MTYLATGNVDTVFDAVHRVVEDPCLVPVAQRLLALNTLEQARSATTALAGDEESRTKGIGLCAAVKPLDAVLWVRRRPWVLPLGGALVVGGLFALGYAYGRRSRSP